MGFGSEVRKDVSTMFNNNDDHRGDIVENIPTNEYLRIMSGIK